jgi:glycosyltransferase involved in cell wall biosynthesis
MKLEDRVPLVSISCLAFNHEEFIRRTLEGFVMQETDFVFEVLIHDDASTDRTADIIREYQTQYPEIIKPIFQTENQWRKGNRGSAVHNFPRAKGKYIALCEGDDYWTDPTKLQRQVDFLESHADYSLVAENGLVLNSEKNTEYKFNDIEETDITIRQLLGKRKFPTASVMFRSAYLDASFYKLKYKGDIILWCYLASKGKIRYLPNISSVYSRGLHGMVLSSRNMEWALMLEEWNKVLSGILPDNVDQRILAQRNYNEYIKVFYLSADKKDKQTSRLALRKCFKLQPISTAKAVLTYYAKKITKTKRSA